MPRLTKEQAFEAVMELAADERAEVFGRIEAQIFPSPELSEEHKAIIRDEIAAHRRDPSTSVSREELMAKMRSA